MSLNTKVTNMSIVNLLILNNFSLCFMGLRPIFHEIAILESMVQNSTVSFPWINKLDQSVNHTWKNLNGGLNTKFQKRKPSRRTNGRFVNDVLSSWQEMKIGHIRNAIDAQRVVMLEIIEKQGGPTTFLSSNTSCRKSTCDFYKFRK